MAEFQRAVIIGVGLLGGSIGLALRSRKLAENIIGVGRRKESLKSAIAIGAIEEATTELDSAVQNADLVVVCTPVQQIVEFAKQAAERAASHALITDVGSTKAVIASELAETRGFCGSHPLAGSDKSGPEHADPELFQGRTVVVTPARETPEELAGRSERFWQALGATTVRLSPEDHDAAVALTSHLPHVVAAALSASTPEKLLPLVASGWCDTTRVAAGGVDLWKQIIEENRQPILAALQEFGDSLQQWTDAIQSDDEQKLESLLATGKRIRDSVGN